jgi:hypothetical protein
MIAHVMDAARRRPDDVVVAGEIAREHAFRAGSFSVGAAIRHRLAAAGLLLRIVDVDAEAFEQFERRDADFGIERDSCRRNVIWAVAMIRSTKIRLTILIGKVGLTTKYKRERRGMSNMLRVVSAQRATGYDDAFSAEFR